MNNTFSEGDLIEATKGERAIRGRLINTDVTKDARWLALPTGEDETLDATYIDWLKNRGWTFTLIEKAAPTIPAESGFYRVGGHNNAIGGTVRRTDDGRWWWIGNDLCTAPVQQTVEQIAELMPLTRLEPVALTAAKVINRVRTVAFGNARGNGFGPARLDEVAREFGVTE